MAGSDTFAFDLLDRWAADERRVALTWHARDGTPHQMTFAELTGRASRLANALTSLGLKPGERILVCVPAAPACWEALLGIIKLGAVAVLAPPPLAAADLVFRANCLQAAGLIASDAACAAAEDGRPAMPTVRRWLLQGPRREKWSDYSNLLSTHALHYARNYPQPADPCLVLPAFDPLGHLRLVTYNQSDILAGTDVALLTLFGPWLSGAALAIA